MRNCKICHKPLIRDSNKWHCNICNPMTKEEIIIREKRCTDCNELIKLCATRCKSCENRNRKGKIEWSEKARDNKRNSNNGMWKGDLVKNNPLHGWVRRNKIKPNFCECCNKQKPYDLANISGKYKRDINDFEWLCRKCHMTKDGRIEKVKQMCINRKRKSENGFLECSICNKFLSNNNFYSDKSKKDKHTSACKNCLKKRRANANLLVM